MKTACFLLTLLLLASLFLPGCQKKSLDAETLALAEACDAACHVRPLAERYQPNAQFPDEPYKRLMECLVTADYRGNLSEEGTDLSHASSRYIYVLIRPNDPLTEEEYRTLQEKYALPEEENTEAE